MDELPTAPGAYRWWYLDARSADGRDALVVIFFCGSVFSPYYAARLRAGERPSPPEHAAVHVALYRDGRRAGWLLAEHDGAIALRDGGRRLVVGRSHWTTRADGSHHVRIDDRAPFPVAGEVSLAPLEAPLTAEPLALCPGVADHRWHALVPRAAVRARFARPAFALDGTGYHDRNAGGEPLERALAGWRWARLHDARGTSVVYDVDARDGRRFSHVLRTGRAAAVAPRVECGATTRTAWGLAVPARVRADGVAADARAVIESTPFYARYLVANAQGGAGLGEVLDLRRFDRSLVRWMLRFRTWRRGGADRAALERGG